ncbi:MAG: RNA polymerase sigma factor [Rhodospirillales bacterium]|nr:RNA polymerase sigma factor [Rhodospirillales bacterium]
MKKQQNKPAAADQPSINAGAHREMVRAFILKLVSDPLLAEDLTQDVFVRVQRTSASFRGDATLKSWLCAIALNIVRDYFRAAGRLPETDGEPKALEAITDGDDIEDGLLEREMAACINEHVLFLPDRLSEVVALHDIAGLSHRQLGPVLGISEGHSRVLLHRGRAALKELLKDNCLLSFESDDVPCERKTDSAKT